MMGWRPRILIVLALLYCSAAPAHAAPDSSLCLAAINATEAASRLPRQMLAAIGVVESGRTDSRTGVTVPWPWTINVAGSGHSFDNAADAITAVHTAQAAGIQSIDVGCMQINLQQHPGAFVTLEQAFDPVANVRYAEAFLNQLHAGSQNWGVAVAAYHSSTPAIGADYLGRVVGVWPLSASYGVTAPPRDGLARGTVSAREVAGASPARSAADSVDPDHVLTPAFRAELVAQAAFRWHRDEALGLVPKAGAMLAAMPRAGGYVTRHGRLVQANLRP